MFTDTTVLSLYMVILLYRVIDREFISYVPRFHPLQCIVLYRALHCLIGNVFYIGLLANYNTYKCYYILRIALEFII